MSLEKYAKKELELAGLFDKDSDYEGMIGKAVMKLIKVFAKQGHSGFSAMQTLAIFSKVANYKPLTPVTNDRREWMEVGHNVWQSVRQSSCFSENAGKTYYDIDEKKKVVRKTQDSEVKMKKKHKITDVVINDTWKTNFRKLPEGLFMWFNVISDQKRQFVVDELTKLLKCDCDGCHK